MKTVWRGFISFGLVSINVELYTAIEPHVIGFKLLHQKCLTPISYKKWCKTCNREVSLDEIVKGYPLQNGKYFVMTKENLEKLKPKKSDYININQFVDITAIPSIYYNNHYYVTAGKTGSKPYYLFLEALQKLQKAAVGQFIMRDKEYVCSIQPYQNVLLLSILNYDYEIKHLKVVDQQQIEDLHAKPEKTELLLAEKLISRLASKKFDISKYKDTFYQNLKKRIEEVASGVKIKALPKEKKPAQNASLVEALKQSIANVKPEPARASSRK